MTDNRNVETARILLDALHSPVSRYQGEKPKTQLTPEQSLQSKEADLVLAMCPEVTVGELDSVAKTTNYSIGGRLSYDHIFVPNPLAGLLQGLYLSLQPVWREVIGHNLELVSSIQGKVEIGITRGKNNWYYLPLTTRLVRHKLAGNIDSTYEFDENRGSSSFMPFTGSSAFTSANLGFEPRARKLWKELGFPRSRDWSGEILYFHNNNSTNTVDIGMYCPKNPQEVSASYVPDEVKRQWALYNESEGLSGYPSVVPLAYKETDGRKEARFLGVAGDFSLLCVTSRGLDRANPDKMTIIMEGLTENEKAFLRQLVEHDDPIYPDLVAASVFYYGVPAGALPWLPPGFKTIEANLNTDTHLNAIHMYIPTDENRNAWRNAFSDSDRFALLGKLDRGMYWDAKAGFADDVYRNFGAYLHKLGIYEEVKHRAVDPVLEAMKDKLEKMSI